MNRLLLSVLSVALIGGAFAYPAPYVADVSTPEARAAVTERLWAHDLSADVRLWPADRLKPGAEEKPFAFTEKELAQSNLVIGDVVNPQFTFFPAKGEGRHPAVVVFPGGGYFVLGWNKEGTKIAEWLNELGFSAAVLLYRTADRDAALCDAQRTMGLLRRDAEKYGIDPRRLGVIGFSAGANLAVRLSTNWRTRRYERVDDADDRSCRPDFQLPIYPWDLLPRNDPSTPWKGHKGMEIRQDDYPVDADTPRAFIVQSEEDFCQPETSLAYYAALKRAKVPAELHLYEQGGHGGHGYGIRQLGFPTDGWVRNAEIWLKRTCGLTASRAE